MTEEITFQAWPKIPRLNRDMVVTEKIDGTNAAVIITEDGQVGAQSRNRLIFPGSDNFGFAGWVERNADTLRDLLGPGRHFGEWWGQGIQRRYGLDHKRFSLFNVHRYAQLDFSALPGVGVVPTLHEGPFDTEIIDALVNDLRTDGSWAAPGQPAEGVVVFHAAGRHTYKVLCEGDEKPKGEVVEVKPQALVTSITNIYSPPGYGQSYVNGVIGDLYREPFRRAHA